MFILELNEMAMEMEIRSRRMEMEGGSIRENLAHDTIRRLKSAGNDETSTVTRPDPGENKRT